MDARSETPGLAALMDHPVQDIAPEAALDRLTALAADLFETPIARIRLDGSCGYSSPTLERLLGYRPGEMLGLPASALVHDLDQPLIQSVFADTIAGGERRTVQLRAAHKRGHPVWVLFTLKLFRDAAGAPAEMFAVFRDISERKAMEAELRQARAEAEAAASAKAEFLANMSHELRTPLTSILGFVGLAGEQPELSDLSRRYVARVADAGEALLSTVNDILDFSKLEAGQVLIHPQPVALGKLARGVIDLFAPQAGAKDLTLTFDDHGMDEAAAIAVDPERVRQILLNLVGNAVKFTERGGVTLRTRYNSRSAMLTVEVIDSGRGISHTDQARLFQRFSQVDGTLTRGHGGTGLGLAICKGLVEAMGGVIGLESVEGSGSRFWFEIPAPPAFLPQRPAQLEIVRPAFEGVRVLVVDDHPANRELARLFLAGIGAEVTEAEDGEAAVRLAAEWPFDVILMDVRMPGLDGPAAFLRIRGEPGPNDAAPVLAFTSDADTTLAPRLLAMGFADVVAKPLEPAVLISAIARATTFVEYAQEQIDVG